MIKTREEEIADTLAMQIAQEIDFEILADMLVSIGWTKVVLKNGALPCTGPELHEWRVRNLKGKWKAHNKIWLFENEQDAVWFTLRWSS
jgi:hypothetical protein